MRTRFLGGLILCLAALLAPAFLSGCGGNDTYNPSLIGGVAAASFNLSVAPASVTVTVGQSATYTATVTAVNGFSSPVNLTVSGLPADTTGTFAPTSVTPTAAGVTSTLTVTTSAGTGNLGGTIRSARSTTPAHPVTQTPLTRSRQITAPGTYTLTVTATGGGVTKTATITLVVQAATAPSFTITAGTSQTVAPGAAAGYNFSVQSVNGFAGTVTFSMTGLPSGATATFSPTSVDLTANGTASASLSVQTAASTPSGTTTPAIVGTSGTLTNQATETLIVTGAPPTTNLFNTPGKLVMTPNRQFAYVLNGGGLSFNAPGFISQHRVNADGTLSNLSSTTLPIQTHPSDIGIDKTGSFVYVTDFGGASDSGRVYQFKVNADGTLSALSPATVTQNISNPNGLLITLDGKFLYVANAGGTVGGSIGMFQISAGGTLTSLGPGPLVGIPAFMVTDPAGKFLYASGQTGTFLFKINADGTLTANGTLPAARMFDMVVDSTGQNLYGTEYNGTRVFLFTINADGTLTALSPASVPAGQASTGLAITPNNQFVYASDDTTFTAPGNILMFKRNADGTLTALSPPTVATGNSPSHLTVDPSGSFLYVPNTRSDSVQVFRINADGTLTLIQ